MAIARALANEPALILADEPTGELDSTTAASIFQLLQDIIAQTNVTIITTTHDRLVMERAQRVLELADGRLQTGETTFQHDRDQAITVPTRKTDEPKIPVPPPSDSERGQWDRPERRRGIYQPPGPPGDNP